MFYVYLLVSLSDPDQRYVGFTTDLKKRVKSHNEGATFVVVSVRDHVIENRSEADQMITAMSVRFGCPAVLIGAQHHRLLGRRDLVQFLSRIDPRRLPWKTWSVAA